jgi:LUC7 N_terminus
MGQDVMSGFSAQAPQISITDPKVCRSFLVGTCPHELFTNTRQDFGSCPKVHSQALKEEYEEADAEQKKKWFFEHDYLLDMRKYIDDCNHKINGAQRRLEKTADEIKKTNALVSEAQFFHESTVVCPQFQLLSESTVLTSFIVKLKQISDLTETINIGLDEVRVLSESGLVNLAVSEFFKIRQTKQQKEELERELKNMSDNSGSSGHQKLQVCDVCGAYLSRLDNDRRLADHFYGKMHLGYQQIRKTYEELSKALKGRIPTPQDRSAHGPSDGDYGDRSYGRRGYRGGGYRSGGGFGGRRGRFGH